MRIPAFAFLGALALLPLLSPQPALAQDPLATAFTTAFRDVVEIKEKAEAGDPGAQLRLANTLAGTMHPTEALGWYRKAAAQGSTEAVYRIGALLTYGAGAVPPDQSIKPNPWLGIPLIFCAATNRYIDAYRDMHRAYEDGLGVRQDTVQAYAWLQLYSDTTRSLIHSSQSELNGLALKVDVATAKEGRRLAALYKAGQWPTLALAPPPAPKPAPRPTAVLKLDGIALGTKPLAVINGKSLAVGESATLPLKPTPVTIKCLKIEKGAVTVTVEGEDEPRLLRIP